MSKVNFGENWSILKGVKANNNQSVDFAGSKPPVAGMGTGAGGAQGQGARKGAKGGSTRGEQVAAKGQVGKTGKLSGRNCIIKEGPHKGAVDPNCDEYQAGLAGKPKLEEGNDKGVIRRNIKRLMEGDAGYASPYLEKGKHGQTYSPAQAAAIAYKKAGMAGKGSSGGAGEKTDKQKFLDKHIGGLAGHGFDSRDKARGDIDKAWKEHKQEMGDVSSAISAAMGANPEMSPDDIKKALIEKGVGSGLSDKMLDQLIARASGKGGGEEQAKAGQEKQVKPMANPDQAGEALTVSSKTGEDVDLTHIADDLIEELKIPAGKGDNYSPSPEQYNALISGIKQKALEQGVDPNAINDDTLKSAIATWYTGMVPGQTPGGAGGEGKEEEDLSPREIEMRKKMDQKKWGTQEGHRAIARRRMDRLEKEGKTGTTPQEVVEGASKGPKAKMKYPGTITSPQGNPAAAQEPTPAPAQPTAQQPAQPPAPAPAQPPAQPAPPRQSLAQRMETAGRSIAAKGKSSAPAVTTSQAPRKGRSRRSAMTRSLSDFMSSKYGQKPPHGWEFCEPAKSTPLIAEGQDANRNLVKVPEGWSPTVS